MVHFLVPGYFIIIFDCVVYTSNNKIMWNNKTPLIKKPTLLITQNNKITWNWKTPLLKKTKLIFLVQLHTHGLYRYICMYFTLFVHNPQFYSLKSCKFSLQIGKLSLQNVF